jgi:CelD/BcsL family acetyltransferase involved in cellulose biosynthesis
MKVRTIGSLREFDALAPAWRELVEQTGQTSPLASHEWFASCWRTAGPERRRELWMVEDCAGPVAMIPLVSRRARMWGLPVRRLEFLGASDAPFVDVPLAGDADAVTNVLLETLNKRRDWDMLALGRLPAQSPLLKTLTVAVADRFPWQLTDRIESPYLTLAGSWDQFLAGLPPAVREAVGEVEGALARRGSLVTEAYHAIDPDGAVFADAVEVAKVSSRDGRNGMTTSLGGMPRLFRELLHRVGDREWLRLWLLRLDGRPIATEYQIGANGVLYTLGVDYDAALADLRPGACLNAAIVRSLSEGSETRKYDMGVGAADSRLAWSNGSHESFEMQVYTPTVYGRLLHRMTPRQCA